MALRKKIGNLIDWLGTKANLPEFGLSERLAGGDTTNTRYGPVAPTTVASLPQTDQYKIAEYATVDSDPFTTALQNVSAPLATVGVGSTSSGTSTSTQGELPQDIRIVGGMAYNVNNPLERQAWVAANNTQKMLEFEQGAMQDEETIRRNLAEAQFQSENEALANAERIAGNEAAKLNFLESLKDQRGDLMGRFSLASTLQSGRYAANPLLQSSQGLAEQILQGQKASAEKDISENEALGSAEYGRVNEQLNSRKDLIARAYANAVERERANLQKIADARANIQNQARSTAIETILPYQIDQGQAINLAQFGAPAQAGQISTADLSKYGALAPSEVVTAGSLKAQPRLEKTLFNQDDEEEKDQTGGKVLDFLKLGFVS